MSRTATAAALALSLLAAPRPAAAHDPPFWWMTDMSGTSRAGLELTLGNPQLGAVDATALGGSVFAEIAVSRTLAFYGRLPLTLVFFDPEVAGEDSEAALGNLSIGFQAMTAHRRGRRMRALLGGGVTVYAPTASEGGAAGAAAAATAQLYLPDPGRWLPDTTTVRLRGDARLESGSLFVQSELALDLYFSDGDDDIDLVAALGPGVTLSSHLAVLLELVVANISDDEQVTADVGIRYHTATMMFGARLYLPLSDPLRDADVFGLGVDVAARF